MMDVAPEVQRMPRLPAARQSETPRLPEILEPTRFGRGTPRDDDQRGLAKRSSDVTVVAASDRVAHSPQETRVGCAIGEQVHDLDAAISPPPGETDTPPDRRVVTPRVSRRRVEHHERHNRSCSVPAAPEAIAVPSVATKRRAAGHSWRSSRRVDPPPRIKSVTSGIPAPSARRGWSKAGATPGRCARCCHGTSSRSP
jgi:hypothetical protein